jgi:hypothetical protein
MNMLTQFDSQLIAAAITRLIVAGVAVRELLATVARRFPKLTRPESIAALQDAARRRSGEPCGRIEAIVMSAKQGILRMMLAAVFCTTGFALAQANAPQGTVVLQCAGTLKIHDVLIPEETGVILDFDNRVLFHSGQTLRIENVTKSYVSFAVYDDVKHIGTLTGGLDQVTGAFTLSGTPESGLSENLKCTPRERRF